MLKSHKTKFTKFKLKFKNWKNFIKSKRNMKHFMKWIMFKKKKFSRQRHIYWTLNIKINKIFWPLVNYHIYKHINFIFTRTYAQNKYFMVLEEFNFDNKEFYLHLKKIYNNFQNFRFFLFFNYIYLYHFLFFTTNIDSFYFIKKFKTKKNRVYYNLILTFKKNKFFINLNDKFKRNYFFLSPGFFIKYFDKKKLYKKSKIIRTLVYKYMRKIFLLISIPRLILIIKKNPIFLLEFLKLFNQPIPHKFNEPLTGREISDLNNKPLTKIFYFIFLNNQSYARFKTKKKGRVKRKIFRKVILRNSIID